VAAMIYTHQQCAQPQPFKKKRQRLLQNEGIFAFFENILYIYN
jgi:hypothetical protein